MAVLRESFALILILIVNVLVITCMRIDASSLEELCNEDFENESPSPADDVPYNFNRTEKGPISENIFDARTDLSYLGSINSKHFYIVRTGGTYAQAVANCSTMGMGIGQPTSQAEINFLFDATEQSNNLAWVGAAFFLSPSTFRWVGSTTSPPAGISITGTGCSLSLAFRRVGATNSGFQSRAPTIVASYFCMLT